MSSAIREGLTHAGILPGGLQVERKAQKLYSQKHIDESPQTRENRIVCAYARHQCPESCKLPFDSRKISFDMIVKTMYETGRDLSRHYRETGEGGLAKLYMHE